VALDKISAQPPRPERPVIAIEKQGEKTRTGLPSEGNFIAEVEA